MRVNFSSFTLLVLSVAALLLASGCGDQTPGVTPTAVPPTATVAVPTDTPIPATSVPTDTPIPTPEPTATATTEPTPTAVPPTPTPLPPTPTSAPPTPTSTPFVIATSVPAQPFGVIGVGLDDVLNVRTAAGVGNPIAWTLSPVAQNIEKTGPGTMVSGSQWVPIAADGNTGWVNEAFLARQEGTIDPELAQRAIGALLALRAGDMTTFSTYVHPAGVRFVPNTIISAENPVWSPADVIGLPANPTVYAWGSDFARGDTIMLTFADYYPRYVWSADFFFADAIGYNTNLVTGGLIDNSGDIYPGRQFVEYHFDGFDPQYTGLDYRTLRLVLLPHTDEWYVVAVVNNEWTP